ncbi:MAG: hypothetical protein AB7P04_05345 [Bacteriovoracia bacterium]
MKPIYVLFLAVVLAVLSPGCATRKSDAVLDAKLRAESPNKDAAALSAQTGAAIDRMPDLTDEQRVRLNDLRISTRNELQRLRDESVKLRSALIKDIVSTTYNAKEIDLIKDRLRWNSNQRLSTIFKAIDQTNTILERKHPENLRAMRDLLGAPDSID